MGIPCVEIVSSLYEDQVYTYMYIDNKYPLKRINSIN